MSALALLWLAACGPSPPSGSPGDSRPDATDGADTAETGLVDVIIEQPVHEPTHSEHIQPIWDDLCRGCHTSAFPHAELMLHDEAYAALVGVPATQSELLLVSQEDVEGSYLWHKLNDTQRSVDGSGDQMPGGGRSPLSDASLQTVRNWIEQGAPP